MSFIEYHADDYGLFPRQSDRILDCITGGVCNGVSIMPNSPYLDECMKKLEKTGRDVKLTVHLNLVEGKPLSGEKASLLTDASGNFHIGFGKLLLLSYIPFQNRKYREQIREELKLQIKAAIPYFRGIPVRLDGHVHYHMLPVVFDAMMDAVKELGTDVSYVRIPAEVTELYARHKRELSGRKPINLVKVLILNLLAARNIRKYENTLSCLKEPAVFSGVMLSGTMKTENVCAILPDLKALAAQRKCDLEVLFHPGSVLEPEDVEKITSPDDLSFLTDSGRAGEAAALKYLKTHKV